MKYLKYFPAALAVLISLGCVSCGKSGNARLSIVALHDLSKVSNNSVLDLNAIVDRVEEIKLDTRSFAPTVGVITYFEETEKFFYIVSDNKDIYQYDKKGNFIRKIGSQGRSTSSYSTLSGIGINRDGSLINVYDSKTNKLLRYSETNQLRSTDYPKFADTTLKVSSFVSYKDDDLIFYTSNNSLTMDLVRYTPSTKKMAVLSRHEREREWGEGYAGRVYSFGDRNNPMLYNYFNDTVYVLRDDRLIPHFLIETGRMKYEIDNYIFDANRNPRKEVSGSKINITRIVKGERFVFINYRISGMMNSFPPELLAIYDSGNGHVIQHVLLEDKETEYRSISGESTLFQGREHNSIIKIRYPYLTVNLNPVLIKYYLK